MKVRSMKRIQDEEIEMDALEVEYEVNGKVKKIFFADFADAVQKINGVEKFKHEIHRHEQRRKLERTFKRVEQKLKIEKFGGDKIEIQD